MCQRQVAVWLSCWFGPIVTWSRQPERVPIEFAMSQGARSSALAYPKNNCASKTTHPSLETSRTTWNRFHARGPNYRHQLWKSTFQEAACDISKATDACTERLQNLRTQRCDKMEQQTHLLKITTGYQSLTSHAFDAYYGKDPCFTSRDDMRLATTIQGLQDGYSSVLWRKGQTRHNRRKRNIATAHDEGDLGNILTPQGE